MENKRLLIDEALLLEVVRVLNIAIGVSSVHAREVHGDILEAATMLDDAINEADFTP